MDYLPIFLDVRMSRVALVGGDPALAGKRRLLRQAGAEIVEIARDPQPHDLQGCAAVFVATGDPAADRAAALVARQSGLPVNVVDRPELSTFIMPAIVDRGPVVVAVSTSGTSPLLARRLRERIDALLPARLGELARFAARFRGAVRAVLPEFAARRRFWERFFDGALAERVLHGDAGVDAEMIALINRPADAPVVAPSALRKVAV